MTEVVHASLERVDRLNGTINAIVTLNPRAMDDAHELDRRIARGENPGPLCGLTVGIKDVTPVAGLRTTFGSPLYADYVPDEDAVVVKRLRDAGAIILGKTNCPEFAAGGNTFNEVFGRTRNPWNTSKSAGGSTGGGAAALAAGMIALAEGTDLGGSLRIPASFCGVVGLRPSVGLVPDAPDRLGVGHAAGDRSDGAHRRRRRADAPGDRRERATRSPLGQPVSGRDFVAAVKAGPHRGARIAYCADPARIGVDPGIERACREGAFGLAQAGAAVEEIDLDLSAARPAFLALRGLWFVTHMTPRLDQRGPLRPERRQQRAGWPGNEHARISRRRNRSAAASGTGSASCSRHSITSSRRAWRSRPSRSSRTTRIRLRESRCRPTSTGSRRPSSSA